MKYSVGRGRSWQFNATSPNSTFEDYGSDANEKAKAMYDYYDYIQQSAASWERLEKRECIQAYSNIFVSDRRHVVLVSSARRENNSILWYRSSDLTLGLDSNWWICSMVKQDGGFLYCNPRDLLSQADSWTVFGNPIDYCLSERIPDVCEVKFSFGIMVIILIFNLVKVSAMMWVLFRFDAEKILTTVGDAVVSFISIEDPTTRGMCLASRNQIQQFWSSPGFARPYVRQKHFWRHAVSKMRWTSFFVL